MSRSPDILNNYDLSSCNTMGVHVKAAQLVKASDIQELRDALEYAKGNGLEILVIGGGSNILFTDDVEGLVILQQMKGIEVLSETDEDVLLKVFAGENWHELVMHCVDQGWGGIENLSLIPGSAGAAPIQNIGAYGVELEEVFESLEAMEIETGEVRSFNREECAFGYRDSIFKKDLKGKFIIISITLRLSKTPKPNLSYKALSDYLRERGIEEPDIREVSDAVIAIRRSKLPDPEEIGNTGSFFKNPVISVYQYDQLKRSYPDLPGYPVSERQVKVPAGWLIEKAGWKGKREGDAGMHNQQALVLVNHGEATGKELWHFACKVRKSVSDHFGIELTPEVNVIS